MNSKQRMLAALNREILDRLPVTTHHAMAYFLDKYLDGISTSAALSPISATSGPRFSYRIAGF